MKIDKDIRIDILPMVSVSYRGAPKDKEEEAQRDFVNNKIEAIAESLRPMLEGIIKDEVKYKLGLE